MAHESLNEKFLQAVATGNIQGIKAALREGADVNCVHKSYRGSFALQIVATYDRNFAVVKLLIDKGADVDLVDESGKSALMLAAEHGCIKLLRLLLFHGASVNLIDKEESTALMYLVSNKLSKLKFLEMAQQLLKHRADVNMKTKSGLTALMVACMSDNYLAVDYLLRHGAEVDMQNNRGQTALMYSSFKTNLVELLLKNRANVDLQDINGCTALAKGSSLGNLGIIPLLLNSGAQVDIPDKDDITALMKACEVESIEAVQLLLDRKALVDMQDKEGRTALMRACEVNSNELVQLLLNSGAQVDIQDKDGKTALMKACERRSADIIVQLLLDYKAQVDLQDKQGKTALTLACKVNSNKIVQLLLNYKAQVEMQDSEGKTALIEACEWGLTGIVQILLDNKAQVDVQDWKGKTALMEACERGPTGIVQLLLDHKAQVSMQDNEGKTALMRACEWGSTDIVKLLPRHEAQVDLQDNEGKTALMKACEWGSTDMVLQLLLKHKPQVDIQDDRGNTALAYAYANREKEGRECGRLLLSSRAVPTQPLVMRAVMDKNVKWMQLLFRSDSLDVNMEDDNEKTVLMRACEVGKMDLVLELLRKEAPVNVQDSEGKTAPMMLKFNELLQEDSDVFVLKRVLSLADADIQDNEGVTVLMKLCEVTKWGHPVIKSHWCELVEVLLKSKPQVNLQDNGGNTALMRLCEKGAEGSARLVEMLQHHGANVNQQDNQGNTALMVTCRSMITGHGWREYKRIAGSEETELAASLYEECIQSLLNGGANVNLQNSEGKTALMMACKQGWYQESTGLLLEREAEVNLQDSEGRTALMIACECGWQYIVHQLLKRKAEVNMQDDNNNTALMIACGAMVEGLNWKEYNASPHTRRDALEYDYLECITSLMNSGSDLELQNSEGKTALMMACQQGYQESVSLFLEKGANMNLQDSEGKTALIIASRSGWIHLVEELLRKGAEIDMLDNDGMSALTASTENDITVLLLKHRAHFELRNMGDVAELIRASKEHSIAELTDMILQTGLKITAHPSLMYNGTEIVRVNTDPPLIAASELGDKDGVQQSLQEGAEINSKGSKGRTALITASGNGHTEVADLLLERGAHIDLQDDEGCSALMTACKKGHIQTTSLLLDEDADTFLKNNEGKTAFDLAVEGGNAELLPLFTKLRRKPTYPGILFLEGSKRETVTLEEKTIDLKEVGISLTIPENSLPSTDPPLQLEVQPCFSGSFELPRDVELVSPAYIVNSSRDIPFEKEVLVKIWHYANLESEEDCEDMVFLSASTTPEYRAGNTPVYVFREIEGGSFRPGEEEPVGQIHLKHFCSLALGKRKRVRESESDSEEVEPKRRKDDMYSGGLREGNETGMDICNDNYPDYNINTGSRLVASLKLSQDKHAKKTFQNHGRDRGNLYSARLYKTIEKKVIFCICLYQPQYIKNCDKVMSVQYGRAEKKIDTTIFNRVQITSSEVCITQSCPEGWAVVFDREPASILREEVNDQEIFDIADLLDMDYPPKIEIVIQSVPTSPDSGPLCLHVEGLNRESTFIVNQADLGPVDKTPQAVKQVDTAVIKLAVTELKDEIQNQSSSHLSVAPISTTLLPTANEMRVMMETLEQMLQCCSSGDSLHYLVNEMEKKSRLLKEKTEEVLRYIKIRCDMDVSVERANTLALQMKMVYMANMQHWDTPEWQCAVGLFVANAANLMKAIKDTLRASKLAQEIPNNLLISSPGSASHPSINNLTLFKWEDCNGKVLDFRLLDEVSAGWRQMGLLLGLSMNILESISRDKPNTTEKCQEMFSLWLDRYHHCYPPTWRGLYKLLCDVRKSTVADKMKKALEFHGIQL